MSLVRFTRPVPSGFTDQMSALPVRPLTNTIRPLVGPAFGDAGEATAGRTDPMVAASAAASRAEMSRRGEASVAVMAVDLMWGWGRWISAPVDTPPVSGTTTPLVPSKL